MNKGCLADIGTNKKAMKIEEIRNNICSCIVNCIFFDFANYEVAR